MMPLPSSEQPIKPFIKWVGGKRQLLPEILRRLPVTELQAGALAYAEPFVGGGAVLFSLLTQFPNLPHAVINDLNPLLINAYDSVRNDTEALIATLQALESRYLALPPESRQAFYLEQRERFNMKACPTTEQAALLLFLNRTCFNGLYRENARGAFNVPFGKAANPKICDRTTLRADATLLQRVTLQCGDFAATLEAVNGPAFFYLDPPYKPISQTSSFNAYTKVPFDDAEQLRLRDFCRELDRRGHRFLLSNSDPGGDFFDTLYAGFRIERVKAKRFVNANPAKRGALDELLISNERLS